MANVNSTTVSGNLTRDPEVRWLADDGKSAIVNVGIAVNRRRFDKATEDYVEEVSFFDIEVFGGFAILAAKKLKKGDSTTVQGRLQQQTWGEGDEKKSKVVIVADQIDSEGFFRAQTEDAVVALTDRNQAAAPAATATEAAPAAAAADDDIPF
jgi:single-strand DNA-binding protein